MKKLSKLLPKSLEREKSSEGLQVSGWLTASKQATLERYGDSKRFFTLFNPKMQDQCIRHIERSLFGNAPSLMVSRATYGEDQVKTWLIIQLHDLNEYAGVKAKMTIEQMDELAGNLMVVADKHKITDVLLFFKQFKMGKYAKMYGVVDPMEISASWVLFLEWRMAEMNKVEQRRNAEKLIADRERSMATAITREEYLKRKAKRDAEKIQNTQGE